MQTGIDGVDGHPFDNEVTVRRYRCRNCGAVITVMPSGLLPQTRYRAEAILLGLVLWVVEGRPSVQVRRLVSTRLGMSTEAERGWPSLRRWMSKVWQWWGLRRPPSGRRNRQAMVEALLQQLAARALVPAGALVASALDAVSHFHCHGGKTTREATPTN